MLASKTNHWLEQQLLPCCFLLALIVLGADYLAGPLIQFPILYLAPVGLVTWYSGRRWGLIFAVTMGLARLLFFSMWITPWGISIALINTLIRLVVFTGYVYLIAKMAVQHRAFNKEVRILTGLLPICSFCKKIRDTQEVWQPLETYITRYSEAEFSHGLCSECARIHYPEYYKD